MQVWAEREGERDKVVTSIILSDRREVIHVFLGFSLCAEVQRSRECCLIKLWTRYWHHVGIDLVSDQTVGALYVHCQSYQSEPKP